MAFTVLHKGKTDLTGFDVSSDDKIMVYLSIPSMSGYKLKVFPKDLTVHDVVVSLNNSLPTLLQSERYYLFHNGIRIFESDKTLAENGIPNMAQLELKRGNEFEFLSDDGISFSIEGESDLGWAVKRIGRMAFPDHKKNYWDYSLKTLSNGTLEAVNTNVDTKFHTTRLRNNEMLHIYATSKKPNLPNSYKVITVLYSPFDDREKQKKTFEKQGYMKKQGGSQGGTKNWLRRFFVLTSETLSYFKDQNAFQNGREAKGVLHLDQFVQIKEHEVSQPKLLHHCFLVETATRTLYCKAESSELMAEWINCIEGMGALARSDINYDTDEDKTKKLKIQQQRATLAGSGHVGIGTPYGFALKTRINSAWQWTGDVHPASMFALQECLGVGASAKVYKAKHKQAGFDIAIKIIHNLDHKFLENLEKEIVVLKRCKSPLVVAYYGTYLDEAEQDVWILMDYCGAGSVKDVMKIVHETLTESQCAYVIQQSLAGLFYLHSCNILHMDIKCANILLTLEGVVKLADFGVSEQLRDINTFIDANDYVGSPLFMAPEVIRKDRYNDKADIWSLGITIIEMYEGRPPNTDINSIDRLPEIAERDPPTFKDTRFASPDFISFLALCLIKNVEERPSASDLFLHEFMQEVRSKDSLMETINEAHQLMQNNKMYASMTS